MPMYRQLLPFNLQDESLSFKNEASQAECQQPGGRLSLFVIMLTYKHATIR